MVPLPTGRPAMSTLVCVGRRRRGRLLIARHHGAAAGAAGGTAQHSLPAWCGRSGGSWGGGPRGRRGPSHLEQNQGDDAAEEVGVRRQREHGLVVGTHSFVVDLGLLAAFGPALTLRRTGAARGGTCRVGLKGSKREEGEDRWLPPQPPQPKGSLWRLQAGASKTDNNPKQSSWMDKILAD